MIVLKIVFTVIVVLMLIFLASGSMMIWERDTKREKLWFRITQISGALLALMMVGSFLVLIWTDN